MLDEKKRSQIDKLYSFAAITFLALICLAYWQMWYLPEPPIFSAHILPPEILNQRSPTAVLNESWTWEWEPRPTPCPVGFPEAVRFPDGSSYEVRCGLPLEMRMSGYCALTLNVQKHVWFNPVPQKGCRGLQETFVHEILHIAEYRGGGHDKKIQHYGVSKDHDFIVPAQRPLLEILQNNPDLMKYLEEKPRS